MKLLTKEIIDGFKKHGRQEHSKDPVVVCKFFDPTGSWTWYVTEAYHRTENDDINFQDATEDDVKNSIDTIFFGFVKGFEKEWGTFSLSELSSVKGKFGLGIERDMHFKAGPFSTAVPERDK